MERNKPKVYLLSMPSSPTEQNSRDRVCRLGLRDIPCKDKEGKNNMVSFFNNDTGLQKCGWGIRIKILIAP